MANNHVITNHFNTVSPAVWVPGNHTESTYGKLRRLDEDTLAALYTMASSDTGRVNVRKAALCRGKHEKRNNPTERPGTNTHPARHPYKMNRKDQITAIISGRIAKSTAYSRGHPIPENMQRRRELRERNEREYIKNQKLLARWLDSEYDRKGKEAVDSLAGLMEGFGFGGGAGEKAQDKMAVDMMSGLEKKMAMLDVIHEDDEEIM